MDISLRISSLLAGSHHCGRNGRELKALFKGKVSGKFVAISWLLSNEKSGHAQTFSRHQRCCKRQSSMMESPQKMASKTSVLFVPNFEVIRLPIPSLRGSAAALISHGTEVQWS